MKGGAAGAAYPGAMLLFLLLANGCGGGGPLFHPAHVLRPGVVSAGAGVSGQIALQDIAAASGNGTTLGELAVAPAVASWVGARVGIKGDNEAGLSYTGRTLRLDARHAFVWGSTALSLGGAASAVMARRPGQSPQSSDDSAVFGGGFDVPVLFGWQSESDLYSLWLGPRAGMEFLSGRALSISDAGGVAEIGDVTARHIHAGFVAGLRAGFRHVHVAIEINGAYHRADGSFASVPVDLDLFTLTPGGALFISF